MCGIAGYLTKQSENENSLSHHARAMCRAIEHRGPDDDGVWSDVAAGVVLGHRRLSILDLSPTGHQPMVSHCGRYVVVYNGEIYNHLELRAQLGAVTWRGHSDTETLLACFSQYGIPRSLSLLVGMYAFAVWDRQERSLTLARDRMGEKPLYWGRLPCGDIVFASELKALRAHPRWSADINRDALALFMRHNAVPAPHTIYQGISKLRPAHSVVIDFAAGTSQETCYWGLSEIAAQSRGTPKLLDDGDAVDELERLLKQSVQGQTLADVPVGAFLSGGVDSSAVVALMAKSSSARVRTFSIGFHEAGYDEAPHAKAVAQHLGTDHTEWYVTGKDALDVVPRLAEFYDEPFADSSSIPTLLVSKLARKHVTVCLSGDGGDELFAGYNRYLLASQVWNRLERIPFGMRKALANLLLSVPTQAWDKLSSLGGFAWPRLRAHKLVGDKLHKFAAHVLPARNQSVMYRSLVSHWQEPTQLVLGAAEPTTLLDQVSSGGALSPVETMCLLDQQTYLPDDILAKVDRAAMAWSLETRVPLLDHRIVEFSWRLPLAQKIRHRQTKWLLRQVLYRHVPKQLIERPKQGFGVPLADWLRSSLRTWVEDLLDPGALRRDGFLNEKVVQQHWREHLSGARNWQYLLWDVVMFQAWLAAARK